MTGVFSNSGGIAGGRNVHPEVHEVAPVQVHGHNVEGHDYKDQDGRVQLGHRLGVQPRQLGELGVDEEPGGQPLQQY